MLRLAYKYQDEEKLIAYLRSCSAYDGQKCLVQIYTSSMNKHAAVRTAKVVKEMLRGSRVIGATSGEAVIYCGEQVEGGTIILIDVYDSLEFQTALFTWNDKSAHDLANQVQDVFAWDGKAHDKMVHIIFSGGYHDGDEFLREMNAKRPALRMVGGISGPTPHGEGFVFTHEGAYSGGAVAFSLEGPQGQYFSQGSVSHEEISSLRTVTGVEDDIVTHIDRMPAKQWLYEYLDIERDEGMDIEQWSKLATDEYMCHFPLVLSDGGCARFGIIQPGVEGIRFHASKLPQKTKFRVGYVTPSKVVQQTSDLCERILDIPVEQIFAYACLFRKRNLRSSSRWELQPFKKYGICGMYNMGEIVHKDGKNYLLHGSCVFTGIAEKEQYMLPNVSEIERMEEIGDDKSFVEKATEKQRQTIKSHHAHRLLNKLKNYQEHYDTNECIDKDFGIPNFYQFEADKKIHHFDKLCMVEIQSADTTMAFSGAEAYYNAVNEVLGGIAEVAKSWGMGFVLPVYVMNYKTMLLPASDIISEDAFLQYCRKLADGFSSATTKDGITGVGRFIVVLDQENMIDVGLNALLTFKDSPDSMIICDKDTSRVSVMEEIKALALLRTAIDQKQVVPYYQGIYNNSVGKIDKYEALMRIVDGDGNIYSPFVFLNVAQTYKFYNKLSRMMIDRSLSEFDGRSEMLSINVSLYDIVSSSFRRWMIKRIKKYANPQNITVEFTETHDLKSLDVLFEFVSQLRDIGVRIAVDDFGSGYSTFASIVALKPTYIKIDGSIISGVVDNEDNRIILDTIGYLAKRMGTQTVAEFVENEDIQNIILKSGGDFSQGYHFSKPLPIDML